MLFKTLLLSFFVTSVTADSNINSRIRIACARIAEDNLYLFSHESNLFQYWRCLNDNITLMNCAEGYQFNESDQSCNIFSENTTHEDVYVDENVGEDEFEYEYEDENEDQDEGEDSNEDFYSSTIFWGENTGLSSQIPTTRSETCNTCPTEVPLVPPPCSNVSYNNIVLQKHANSSSMYWKCVGSIAYEQSCLNYSWFKFFDEERQLCEDMLLPFNRTRNDPKCANTVVDYLPHSFDCSKFVKCYLNESYEGECPSGFHFDKNEKKCKHAASVQCMTDTRCNSNKEFIKFLPHPTSCSKFIECYDYGQISYVRECPKGDTFNAMKQKCINRFISGAVDCTVTEPPWAIPESVCSNVTEGEVVLKRVSSDECKFYWECKGTSQTLKRCPEKLLFDEEQQLCSANAQCYSEIKKLYAWTSQPFLTSLSVYEHPICEYDDYQRKQLFPHPRDCSRFIECIRNEAVERKCPQGLYFDSLFQKCTKFIFSNCGK